MISIQTAYNETEQRNETAVLMAGKYIAFHHQPEDSLEEVLGMVEASVNALMKRMVEDNDVSAGA